MFSFSYQYLGCNFSTPPNLIKPLFLQSNWVIFSPFTWRFSAACKRLSGCQLLNRGQPSGPSLPCPCLSHGFPLSWFDGWDVSEGCWTLCFSDSWEEGTQEDQRWPKRGKGERFLLILSIMWKKDGELGNLGPTCSSAPPFLDDGSNCKESACNAGDLVSIPGSGRSPGEGNGYPLQYSCLENPMDRGAWRATVHGVTKSGACLRD